MTTTQLDRINSHAQRLQRGLTTALADLHTAQQIIARHEARERRVRDLAECWLPIHGVENWCAQKVIGALDKDGDGAS